MKLTSYSTIKDLNSPPLKGESDSNNFESQGDVKTFFYKKKITVLLHIVIALPKPKVV